MNYKFSLETNFKQTEIGEIPKDWDVVRLGEVSSIDWGNTSLTKSLYKEYGYSAFSATGMDGFLDFFEHECEAVIVSAIGARCGKCFYASGKWTAIKNTIVVKANKLANNLFLYFYLDDENKWPRSGSGQPFISLGKAKQIPIPLPPLPEQQAIAEVLATIQEAKEKTEAVIKATRELKKSMMKHLFSYGVYRVDRVDRVRRVESGELRVDRVDRVESGELEGEEWRIGSPETVKLKETEIGLIPEDWDVVRLGEVIEKTNQSDIQKKSDWKFKYIDVSCIDNILLKIVTHQVFTGKTAPSRARKVIKIGDVIFATVRPYLKRIAIVSQEFDNQICSTAFCVLRPKSNLIDGNYLFFVVSRDEFVSSVSEHQRGSSYPAITDNDVKNGFIPLPPLPVQQKIAEILKAIDDKIEKEEAKKKALENLFKSMLHNLMTGKIRVKIIKQE